MSQENEELRNLEALEISDEYGGSYASFTDLSRRLNSALIAFHNVLNLRKLVLQNITVAVNLPWAQLTELVLRDMHSRIALDIALKYQNLVTLTLQRLLQTPIGGRATPPAKTLVLKHLETFEYTGPAFSEKALVKCLSFTRSSKKFALMVGQGTSELRRELLLNLPTSITEFRLSCLNERDTIRDYEHILSRMTDLKALRFKLGDTLDLEIVQHLTVTRRNHLLPLLSSIELVMLRSEYDRGQLDLILEMARLRWETRDQKATFEGFKFIFPFANMHRDVSWKFDFKARLESIVSKELEVKVSDGYQGVSILTNVRNVGDLCT